MAKNVRKTLNVIQFNPSFALDYIAGLLFRIHFD